MKNPFTARRERRILAALAALGPTDELALYLFLNGRHNALNAALLNLATEGRITCSNRASIVAAFAGTSRVWRLAEQEGADQ